ncbi:P-loop NTPase [Deltaproteobacteria bacterium TL4]
MKLAISGKGGVGKSSMAAALSLLLARRGGKVLAVDADPDSNLASYLGISEDEQKNIIPISKQVALIEERTGAKVKRYGQIFKINPEVSDIAGSYATMHEGVALLVLGAVEQGGSGCACPENILIRALVTDLVLYKDEALIMDMEAGVEHLGRATSRGVDTLLVVVEPGQRSIDCAQRVIRMAAEIGLNQVQFVANKVASPEDEQFIRDALHDHELLGVIPYSESIRLADRKGGAVLDNLSSEVLSRFETLLGRLEELSKK